jgi:transposase
VALTPIDTAIQVAVQHQPQLWVDETSWREQQQRGWLWVAVSPVATCFRIGSSRSQQALRELIGAHNSAIVHSDRASMYHVLPDGQRQLCWAHILRNLQSLVDHQHAESGWSYRILQQAGVLFTAWHAYRSGLFDQIALQQALIRVRLALHDLLELGATRPWPKLQAVCQDLLRHWEALRTFNRIEGLEPINKRGGQPICRAHAECAGDLRPAGAQRVCVLDRGGARGVGRTTSPIDLLHPLNGYDWYETCRSYRSDVRMSFTR